MRLRPTLSRPRARLGLALMGITLTATACTPPDAAFVRAERATFQAVAPEYVGYVRADPALTAEQRARRERTVATWDLSIRGRERATAGSAPATNSGGDRP